MRQKRWVELIKDYDLTINYTPEKANVVANALSRKESCNPLMKETMPRELRDEIRKAGIEIWDRPELNSIIAMEVLEEIEMDLKENILSRQKEDEFLAEEIRRIQESRNSEFTLKPEDDSLWYHSKIGRAHV